MVQPSKRRVIGRILRWTAVGVGGLFAVVLLAAGVLYLRGRSIVFARHDITPPTSIVPTDSAMIARGEHVALTHTCFDCHGARLEGQMLVEMPFAVIAPPNLTRGAGGVGSRYSAADWDRAIRYGVRPDGRALLPMMPFEVYNRLNDADMAALAAYLSAVPAVDNQVPRTRTKQLGYIMLGVFAPSREGLEWPRTSLAPAPTAEYGAYFASTICTACHGDHLEGAEKRGFAAPGLHAYGMLDVGVLARALRTGIAADGRELDKEVMPWPAFSHMDDVEIAAIHSYLATLDGGTRR